MERETRVAKKKKMKWNGMKVGNRHTTSCWSVSTCHSFAPRSLCPPLLLRFSSQSANGRLCPLDDEHGFVVSSASRRRPEQQIVRARRRRRRRVRRHRRRHSLRGHGRSGAAQVPRAEEGHRGGESIGMVEGGGEDGARERWNRLDAFSMGPRSARWGANRWMMDDERKEKSETTTRRSLPLGSSVRFYYIAERLLTFECAI